MALENKLGITSSAELAREEERISKKKAVELFESGTLDKLEPGKFASLQAIHKALFEDNLTKKQVVEYSPIIADRKAMTTASMTPEEIAAELKELFVPNKTEKEENG